MRRVSIAELKETIDSSFTSTYRNTAAFAKSKLYEDIADIIFNIEWLKCIVFANDVGVTPTKSVLWLLGRKGALDSELSHAQAQCLGALMSMLFGLLGYKQKKIRQSVNMAGVKTATLFYDADEFELTES